MMEFWDVAPFIIIEIDRRFRDAYCRHHQDTSEASVHFETTLHYIPDGCHRHTRCRENLKYHILNPFFSVSSLI
jgi:hypothetical protein